MYCSPECRGAERTWSVEEILAEESALHVGASHNEMAKVAFGQKNLLQRKVNTITSLRQYLSYEVERIFTENPGARLLPLPVDYSEVGNKSPREVLLICSDWQLGKLEQGIGIDEMVKRRVPRIREATVQIVQHFRNSGHPVPRIHTLFVGDMIEGCYIYGGQNVSGLDKTGNTHRLIRQVALAAQLEAELGMALAAVADEVVVHSVPGNHGRPNGRNDFADPEDNFDTLAAMWARDKAALQGNLRWEIEDRWFTTFDILGHRIVAAHGDQWTGPLWKLKDLLPQWVLANTFSGIPDLFVVGHRHEFTTFEVNGVPVIQNGTIDGGSQWYLKAYGKASRPTQTVVVLSEKRAVEALYPVYF